MRIFEKAFTPPFKVDKIINWVWDSNHNFAFQLMREIPNEKKQQLEDILNGKIKPTIGNHYTHDKGVISINGQELILIRGWGYLTGTGALNLSAEAAISIQDDLANYIIEKLNPIP